MKVYEIVAQSMRLAGRDGAANELIAKYRSNANVSSPSQVLIAAFLIYLNAVLHEISQFYLPVEEGPATFAEADEFSYPVKELDVLTVEYGMVAEHCLVAGEANFAEAWERKFRDSIRATAAKYKRARRTRPSGRRWV